MEKKSTASQLTLPRGVMYVGVDESNHGRFPEILVGAMSGLEEDVIKGSYTKQRKILTVPPSWLNERDYSFLVIEKKDSWRLQKPEFLGTEISSLLQGIENPKLNHLSIFLDGIPTEIGRLYVRDMVSEVCAFPRENITFNFGPRLDETYSLVNLADAIAYNLAFNSNPETWENHPSRKYLIKN